MSHTVDPRSPAALRQKLKDKQSQAKATPAPKKSDKPPEVNPEPSQAKPASESTTPVPTGLTRKQKKRLKQQARKQIRFQAVERLPHNSRFDIAPFDAENAMWTGSLTIPCIHCKNGQMPSDGRECEECNGSGVKQKFSTDSSAIFKLLMKLDSMYRAWLAEQQPKSESPTTPDNTGDNHVV